MHGNLGIGRWRSVWGGQHSVKHVPARNTAYQAPALVVDPDDGVRRAAAVANLQDVLEALVRQSLASGRLRIVEHLGVRLKRMWVW